MSKIYVLRQIAFFFNDEFHSPGEQGGIAAHFTDKDEAQAALNQMSIDRLRKERLGSLKYFNYGYEAELQELVPYLDSILDKPLLAFSENSMSYYAPYDAILPEHLTDEQVIKIIEIMKIEFYQIVEFDAEDAMFYAIWIPRINEFVYRRGWVDATRTHEKATYFYNSRQDALDNLGRHAYIFQKFALEGTFEELSDTPELLDSFVQDKEAFIILKDKIRFHYNMSSEDIIGLNALLKEPLFEIRPLSVEEAAKIPHDPFEAM